MRIVNREEFLKLPENTLFSEFEPNVFTGLLIKEKSLTDDYFEIELIGNIDSNDYSDHNKKLTDAEENGVSLPLDFECLCRNGAFQQDQLYAVYEKQDVAGLIESLQRCL